MAPASYEGCSEKNECYVVVEHGMGMCLIARWCGLYGLALGETVSLAQGRALPPRAEIFCGRLILPTCALPASDVVV
jgi:hypothetical protein